MTDRTETFEARAARTCAPSPTGCSARWPRRTTWSQEAWLRYRRADTSNVDNIRGWLTTVVARLCLDALRSRTARKEDLVGFRLPEPLVSGTGGPDPEQQALLADAVGLAMLGRARAADAA